MALKVILDANVILDLIFQRNDSEHIKTIYDKIETHQIQGHITTSILQICGHWLSKAFGSSNAKKVLIALINDMKIIDATHSIIRQALHSSMNDIEDILQYYIALEHNLDCFISNDKAFAKSASTALPVYTSKQFLKHYL